MLCALHAGVAALLVIIAHVTLLGSCLLAGIHLCEANLLNVSALGESGESSGGREDGSKLLNDVDVGPVGGGELDFELDVQVAEIVMSLSGHTLAHNSLQITCNKWNKQVKSGWLNFTPSLD